MVDNLQNLLDAAQALAWQPLPAGRRIGVISASGGACSVIADESAAYGLELPELPPDAVDRVREIVPAFGSVQNPIDVTTEVTVRPHMLGEVAEVVLACHEVDALIVLLTTNADPPATEAARGVINAAQSSEKPVIVARLGAEFLAATALAQYRDARIPVFPMPDRAVRALRAMCDWAAA